jgi:hypothetical protein
MVTLGLSILAIAWALMMLTPSGELAYAYVFFFLEYYAGVFSLVLLSMTVMGGLLSTDRILMGIKHRILLQSAHRVGGIGAVGFLALHIATKVSMGKASAMDAFVPFMSPFNALYIGLGTIASYLMFAVFLSGILRHRFIGSAKPWVWRGVHALSYVSWPIAIMHGLTAGRAAAAWVTASYVICLLLVTGALFLRLTVGSPRAKTGGTGAGTGAGSLQPIRMPVASQRESANGMATWSNEPPARPVAVDVIESGRPRPDEYESQYERRYADQYDDYDAPYDNGYIDLSDSPARHIPEQAYVTEQIPVQHERERRRLEQRQAHLYGRPKAEDYGRRPRLERYEEEDEGGYLPRRSVEQPPPGWHAGEQQPISGPPRHRLVEENSDSYVPSDARIPTPTYVGTARPRRAIEARRPAEDYPPRDAYRPLQDLEPDDTPTLIDMATRRTARGSGERFRESDTRFRGPRDVAVPSRRGRRRGSVDGGTDERYWVS